MTNFQRRALTAILFGAVMLIGMFWNEVSFYILFFLISMGCLWEFMRLIKEESTLRKVFALLLGSSLWLTSIFIRIVSLNGEALQMGFGWHLVTYKVVFLPIILFVISPFFLLLFELFFQQSEKPFINVGLLLLGIMYAIFPFVVFLPFLEFYSLEHHPFSYYFYESFRAIKTLKFTPNIVAGILFLTWANDTFAYIIGSRIGKTLLFERISPKKTWEGTIGGGIMCILTGIVIHQFLGILSLIDWLVIGGIVAVFGSLGDLVESMFKRSVGVKDSGTFMPGHGGFLDRFDAFIFAVPFVFLYLMLK